MFDLSDIFMIIKITRNRIVIQGAWSTWDVQYVLREISNILLERGYRPAVHFTGTPMGGNGGISVDIVLDKEMTKSDYDIVKKVIKNLGLRLIES